MNEYDNRQLLLMAEKIKFYRLGKLLLSDLIVDLEALNSCLLDVEESWKRQFLQIWSRLEEIYACSLEYQNGVLNDRDKKEINDVLMVLENHVETIKADEDHQ